MSVNHSIYFNRTQNILIHRTSAVQNWCDSLNRGVCVNGCHKGGGLKWKWAVLEVGEVVERSLNGDREVSSAEGARRCCWL